MYPSKILGFININGNDEAVIQCANKHLCWDDLIKHFIIPVTIGCQFDVSFVVVPIESIVHPLCCIPDDDPHIKDMNGMIGLWFNLLSQMGIIVTLRRCMLLKSWDLSILMARMKLAFNVQTNIFAGTI